MNLCPAALRRRPLALRAADACRARLVASAPAVVAVTVPPRDPCLAGPWAVRRHALPPSCPADDQSLSCRALPILAPPCSAGGSPRLILPSPTVPSPWTLDTDRAVVPSRRPHPISHRYYHTSLTVLSRYALRSRLRRAQPTTVRLLSRLSSLLPLRHVRRTLTRPWQRRHPHGRSPFSPSPPPHLPPFPPLFPSFVFALSLHPHRRPARDGGDSVRVTAPRGPRSRRALEPAGRPGRGCIHPPNPPPVGHGPRRSPAPGRPRGYTTTGYVPG